MCAWMYEITALFLLNSFRCKLLNEGGCKTLVI